MNIRFPGDDQQSRRARWDLRVIVAVVGAVFIASLVWRAATGHHAKHETGWEPSPQQVQTPAAEAAAAAGVKTASVRPAAPAR